MSIPTHNIESLDQIIELGKANSFHWYRGHQKVQEELIPRVFRKEHKANPDLSDNFEAWAAKNFKRIAPSITHDIPQANNHLEWLFLMEHYGTPTRLLDWTHNILFAIFFAVTGNRSDDGEVWSLSPNELNKISGLNRFPLSSSPLIQFMVNEPFHHSVNELAKKHEFEQLPVYPVAFQPPLINRRIATQRETFTIHREPQNGKEITDILSGDEKKLAKYVIPREKKEEFEWSLFDLGVTYRTLFPDLEGLSNSIKQESRRSLPAQPEQPEQPEQSEFNKEPSQQSHPEEDSAQSETQSPLTGDTV